MNEPTGHRQTTGPTGSRPTAGPAAVDSWPPAGADRQHRQHRQHPAFAADTWPPDTGNADSDADRQEEDDRPWLSAELGGLLTAPLHNLRFYRESLGSLSDQIEYARRGAYTAKDKGLIRGANIGYVYGVAVPAMTVCILTAWVFLRFSRLLTAVPVLLCILWGLDHLPITAWLIPDWADFETWVFPADAVAE